MRIRIRVEAAGDPPHTHTGMYDTVTRMGLLDPVQSHDHRIEHGVVMGPHTHPFRPPAPRDVSKPMPTIDALYPTNGKSPFARARGA